MDNDYKRAANITIITWGIIAFLWLFFKYAIGAAIPFIIGLLIALLISPITRFISKKTKIPHGAVAAVFVILFFFAISSLIYLAASRLIGELGNLLLKLSEDPEAISRSLSEIGNVFGSHFAFMQSLFESDALIKLGIDLDRLLPEALSSMLSSISAAVPAFAMNVLSGVPEFLLCVAVILISSVYFCTDRDTIFSAFASLLPESWQKKLPEIKQKIKSTLWGYVKAYLIIMLLTFCEVFFGLTVLGVNYALIISIIIAVIDILPILGTGTVLIPWAIFSFITSDTPLGIGLLILYGVVLIIRQLVEPKIVGNTLGLHPLAALASIYLGIRFLGIGGIFIGPIAAMLIKSFLFKKETPAQ